MQDKAEDEGNTVCIDKDDNEILREFNRRQYVAFRCYRPPECNIKMRGVYI